MNSFTFTTTRSLLCEPGASRNLATHVQSLGIPRPFLVTDRGVLATGILQPALDSLSGAGLELAVFADVVADPPEAVVLDALAQARAHQCDGVIGFGGGSPMDTAKLVALLSSGEQSLQQVYGVGNATGKRLPLIQIPTTAGTGSEVTPIATVTTAQTTKMGVVAPQPLPDLAILDATLTPGLPGPLAAASRTGHLV